MGDRFERTATTEVPSLTDFARTVNASGGTRKALMSEVAKLIVESYEGSNLGGENRTIQDAITDAKETASEAIQGEQIARQNADTTITADLAKKAYADGEYADLHAGTANQILSDTYTTDEEPYHYRQTPSHAGTREIEQIVGGSVVWNQVVSYTVGTNTEKGITSTVSEDGTRTLSGTATALWSTNSVTSNFADWENDVIFFCGCPSGGSPTTYYTRNGYSADTSLFDTGNGKIIRGLANRGFIYQIVVQAGTTLNNAVFKPQAVNLTKLFANNPAIADHIYDLEQANAGAGVEFFRKYFPEEYYAYDAGTMRSVEGLVSHDMVGFNQWDEKWELGALNVSTGEKSSSASSIRSKNFIPVFGNTVYYGHYGKTGDGLYALFYDKNKAYINLNNNAVNITNRTFTTPTNARYMLFRTFASGVTTNTYDDNICINLSDTAKNGQYEPYEKHSYPLDSTVTLRGIPQLVDGELKWDGDIYLPSGVISRKFKEVTFDGSSDEAWSLAATYNGTNLKHAFFGIAVSGITIAKNETEYTNEIIAKGIEIKYVPDGTEYNNWTIRKANGTTAIYALSPTSEGDAYNSLSAFRAYLASNPITIVCKLATPTTEQAEPYQALQICSPYGTEEYVSTGIVPIGHYTKYPTDLKGIVEQIADAPSESGTYTLKAVVSSSGVTYSWESANG